LYGHTIPDEVGDEAESSLNNGSSNGSPDAGELLPLPPLPLLDANDGDVGDIVSDDNDIDDDGVGVFNVIIPGPPQHGCEGIEDRPNVVNGDDAIDNGIDGEFVVDFDAITAAAATPLVLVLSFDD
jgi:hypothetical protein